MFFFFFSRNNKNYHFSHNILYRRITASVTESVSWGNVFIIYIPQWIYSFPLYKCHLPRSWISPFTMDASKLHIYKNFNNSPNTAHAISNSSSLSLIFRRTFMIHSTCNIVQFAKVSKRPDPIIVENVSKTLKKNNNTHVYFFQVKFETHIYNKIIPLNVI